MGSLRDLKANKSWNEFFCKHCPCLEDRYCHMDPPQYIGDGDSSGKPYYAFPRIDEPEKHWCYRGRKEFVS